MQIDKIYIRNFKMFKDKVVHLDKQFTLIIGENGTGKTTLLEAIRVGAGVFLAGIDGITTRNFQMEDIRAEWEIIGDATKVKNLQFPAIIDCTGTIGGQSFNWRVTKESQKGRTTRSQAREFIDYAKTICQEIVTNNNQSVTLPVISYFSVGRLFEQDKSTWVKPYQKEDLTRFYGYKDCLDSKSNIKLFVSWFRKMEMIRIQKNKQIGELNAVKQAVVELIQLLFADEEEIAFFYDFEEEEVVVEIGNKRDTLRIMSSGYRTVIGMVADIAYRMALLNPHLREKAVKQTPGVVLIDELDLHLHPKWQWNIIHCLKTVFPNVQFIATTHAPIVISSSPDSAIIDMHEHSEDEIEITQKPPYGWLMEDILTDKMDTHGRSREIERMIRLVQIWQVKKLNGTLSEQELLLLKDTVRTLSQWLPESDPAVMLTRVGAITESAGGLDDGKS